MHSNSLQKQWVEKPLLNRESNRRALPLQISSSCLLKELLRVSFAAVVQALLRFTCNRKLKLVLKRIEEMEASNLSKWILSQHSLYLVISPRGTTKWRRCHSLTFTLWLPCYNWHVQKTAQDLQQTFPYAQESPLQKRPGLCDLRPADDHENACSLEALGNSTMLHIISNKVL